MKPRIFKYKTDVEAEKEGMPFNWNGVVFYVRRLGTNSKTSIEFMKAIQELQLEFPDFTIIKEGEIEKRVAEITAKYLVSNWENMIDEETGEEIPFNRELLIDILTQIPDVCTGIQNFASERKNYLLNCEGIKKN